MSSDKLSVRPAVVSDALAIGQIQSEAMLEAISAGMGTSPGLATRMMLDVGALASVWTDTLSRPAIAGYHVLVADANETVEGLAVLAPADPVILEGDDPHGFDEETGRKRLAFEIQAFDVPSRLATQQHEPRMLAALTDIAKDAGATEIHIWVIAGHDKMTNLLTQTGFRARPLRRVANVDGGEVAEFLWWALL
ncbi:hypothetical protein [Arcanobacterium pinnipediorum]|uniref:N-acetyltransferase domain-containing protein n=1 Tax=Arcanobacterium pinnipediorum TaxID=1503041 RepID=A0ABY5AJG4_9ACTO|nr:hypothetical protein [Arcanobacterium pinnipediorum]USR79992.1 hypothetical protein NG665_03160 [Arcanobacterium pinnipediorum]